MRAIFFTLCVCTIAAFSVSVSDAAPRVEFELVTERGVPPTVAHEWLNAMKELDQNGLRIRGAETGDSPSIDSSGSGENAFHRVTGVITAANILRLPGASFRSSEKRAIATWIANLKAGATGAPGEKAAAFGLTSKQLLAVHEALSVRVTFVTSGQSAKGVAQRIVRNVPLELVVDDAAKQAINAAGDVTDELQGISAGTALAALLRPLGLILVPQKGRGEEVRLLITDIRGANQNWPVGWPSEKDTSETLPALLKFLNVEIDNTPVTEALAAIQQRLEVPFLLDHNSLARQKIDLQKMKVSMPGGRTFYGKVLNQILWPSKLTWELRLDEASRPFVWISTKLK